MTKRAGALIQYTATAMLVTFIAITAYAGRAAFIEPLAGPGSSSQDSAQNILGANNINNAFDSSSVTANGNGSIVERLEYIAANLFWVATGSDIYRLAGSVGVGTTTPGRLFSVEGPGLFKSSVTGSLFNGTDSTATSTFGQGIDFTGGGFIYDNGSQLIIGHR